MAITNITNSNLIGFDGNTSSVRLPVGTTAERPGSAANADLRFNTDTSKVEYYDGSNWIEFQTYNPDVGTYKSWDISGLTLSSTLDLEAEGYLYPSVDGGFAFDVNQSGDRITFWGSTENLDWGFGSMTQPWVVSSITGYTLQNTSDVNYRIPNGVRWSNDGNNFYVNQSQYSSYAGTLRQWELSTPFDSVSYGGQTRSLTTGKFRGGQIYMSKDGSKMIISEQHQNGTNEAVLYSYSLSTNFNISTATQTSSYTLINGNFGTYAQYFDVNEDFGQIYIGRNGGYLRYATISNLDVSTITLDSSKDLDVTSIGTGLFNFRISPDSSTVLLADASNNSLYTLT